MLKLEDLQVYKISMEIGDDIWKIVERWNFYQKDTLGKQLTRSADSISLNISEGYEDFTIKTTKISVGIVAALHMKHVVR